jgi:outer membrane protein TolC
VVLAPFVGAGCAHPERYHALRQAALEGTRVPRPPEAEPSAVARLGPTADTADAWAGVSQTTADELVERVLARNPSLAAMQAAWRAAVERYPQVTALDDPDLEYGLAPYSISTGFNVAQRFEASQRFPWPGRQKAMGEAALDDASAAGEDVHAMRLRLAEEAREAFFDLYYVYRALDINEANQELVLDLQKIAEERYATGLAAKQDALQAAVMHQHLVHRDVVLGRVKTVAEARINVLLNLPPETPVPPPPTRVSAPTSTPDADAMREQAVHNRPELAALADRLRAREAEVRVAELEYYPSLTAFGAYDSFWTERQLRPMVGVGINVPLQLERRRAAVDEARAAVLEADSLLRDERNQVLFEVTEAVSELAEQHHVLHLYGASILPAAEEALEAARTGYENDTNDFATLIEAEQAVIKARLGQEKALADYYKARARLDRAVGRGVDDEEVAS